jgi:hypothetical protein
VLVGVHACIVSHPLYIGVGQAQGRYISIDLPDRCWVLNKSMAYGFPGSADQSSRISRPFLSSCGRDTARSPVGHRWRLSTTHPPKQWRLDELPSSYWRSIYRSQVHPPAASVLASCRINPSSLHKLLLAAAAGCWLMNDDADAMHMTSSSTRLLHYTLRLGLDVSNKQQHVRSMAHGMVEGMSANYAAI